MIILRQKEYSINKKAAAEIAGKLTKLGIIGTGLGIVGGAVGGAIKKHKKRHEDLEERLEKLELDRLGQETDKDIREAVKGTKAEKKVDKILDKSTKEMKKAAQKEYSWFNSYDIFDFVEDVKNCNYPNKDKELKNYTMDWDSTYKVFSKGKVNKKEIARKLNTLESLVSDVLKKNNIPGNTKDWQLYVVYLVGPDKIGLGLENTKNKNAFSCEI